MHYLLPFLFFVPVCIAAFTIPGIYILRISKVKFSLFENIFVGTSVGFVIFTLLSYILLMINLTILLLLIYLVVNILSFRKVMEILKAKEPRSTRKFIIVSAVLVLGIIFQVAIIAPSGITQSGDILFWSSHGHDGPWHIALMEVIKNGWPLSNPVMAGERLVNYHFFSDIAPAMFSKYLRFDNLDLYFRLFPVLYSVLLGGSVYLLVKRFTSSVSASIWATFFTYFAGSFGFIVTYLKNGSIGGESIFWATQIQSSSGNPPQIISNFLVLTYLFLFLVLIQKRNKVIFTVSVLILGSLALFKVYAAIALIAPTLLVGLWILIRRRDLTILGLGLFGSLLAGLIYIPNVSTSTSFLIFEPWWYIRTMIVEPSRLDWLDHELRRQTYIYEGNTKRVIFLELQGLLIFFFGNLGMRFIGLWDFVKTAKKSLTDPFSLLLISIILISLIFPLLFLQRGVASNTSQFFQYFILLFGILAGISVNNLLTKIKITPAKLAIALVIIIISLPTQVGLLREFYSRDAFAKISTSELEALSFIKENTKTTNVILTAPYDQYFNLGDPIPNIWDWYDTSYVAAFANRAVYFDDHEQVDIMGYEFKDREKLKIDFFAGLDPKKSKGLFDETKADILYFPKKIAPKVNLSDINLRRIYENVEVEIWQKIN